MRGENLKDPPVILSDNHPCIVIRYLEPKDKINLKNLKLINRGKRIHLSHREQDPKNK